MARQESEREDLLHEATGLVQRVELQIDGCGENVIVGFRSEGAGSIYFGQDPVFQFNVAGQLRRAHWEGKPIKSEMGRLVSLTRIRDIQEVQLQRHDFTAEDTGRFKQFVRMHLSKLQQALLGGSYTIIGQVPEDEDIVRRINAWLESLDGEIQIADSPRVR